MKKQALNPYLPSYEYIPDGEPYVFEDRLYVFGSHDRFDGTAYCQNDYVTWSAPLNDLSDWRYEGVIYRKEQDPTWQAGQDLWAPDVQRGADGRYYLFYSLSFSGTISVAAAAHPAGPYEFYGQVHDPDGAVLGTREGDVFQFDPGVLVDDDGRVYLYSGFAPIGELSDRIDRMHPLVHEGGYFIELEPDMLTIKRGPELLFPMAGKAAGTGYEGHEFFEASSLRKIGGIYYFIYSSINGHELCYATSDRPYGGFVYRGTIISNGDIGLNGHVDAKTASYYTANNHGSLVEVNGQWYIFYHRHTNRHQFSRQGCAEPVSILPDGSIPQVEKTSCGLNGGALCGKGNYEAGIACNLTGKHGALRYPHMQEYDSSYDYPYITQDGVDRETDPGQYIANFRDGAEAGYKYFDLTDTRSVTLKLRGHAEGTIRVLVDGIASADIPLALNGESSCFAEIPPAAAKSKLAITYHGSGSFDFLSFTLD